MTDSVVFLPRNGSQESELSVGESLIVGVECSQVTLVKMFVTTSGPLISVAADPFKGKEGWDKQGTERKKGSISKVEECVHMI